MIIHIVESGETIDSIAEKYNVAASKLITDNMLPEPYVLVPGQTIVIVYPEQTYVVQEGDTLAGIADLYNVTVKQLLRNNPTLSDRDYLIPGEHLTISYANNKGQIAVNGFAYVFIDKSVLRKTLPYLTYLTILNYRFTEDYQVIGEDDSEIIQMTKAAGVIPLLQVTSFIVLNQETIEATLRILYSEEIQELLINNMLNILRSSGYNGVNITFSYIDSQNYPLYNTYLSKVTERLNAEGYLVFVTLAPRERININEITIDKADLTEIGQMAYGINLLGYDFGITFNEPNLQTTTYIRNEFIEYAKTLIPEEKIYIGLSSIAYDWPLPFEACVTKANSMSTNAALELASVTGATILYDDLAEAAYFEYYENRRGVPILHLVWFIDARSVDARAKQVIDNDFRGLSIWNIMFYYAQMWLIINSQYEIITINPDQV
jgi:spore germination protein